MMTQLPYTGTVLGIAVDGLLKDEDCGTVTLRRDGRIRLDYSYHPALLEAFRSASVAIARVSLAAGADEVHSGHIEPVVVRSEADIPTLEAAAYGPHEHPIFTAHQMGGCAMGGDPRSSVVSSQLRHHDTDNLFVVDGSVLPTGLGVNPSETIYGIAHRSREWIAAAV